MRGRKMRDQNYGFALARERALLSVLTPQELEQFIDMQRRTREKLPNVDVSSEAYVALHWSKKRH
jgi:hypothetical protein